MKPFWALLFLVVLNVQYAWAQSTATGPHIEVALLSESDTVVVGEQQWLAIQLSPDDEWHTYWRNAGDSGEAPTVSWQSNGTASFGEFHWPLPEQIPVAHLVNYGYSGSTLLMVPFTLENIPASESLFSITADVSWLVCKEDCIPGWATLTLGLPIDKTASPSTSAELFQLTFNRLPADDWLSASYEITDQHVTLEIDLPKKSDWQLLPFRSDLIQHNSQQQWLVEGVKKARVLLTKSDYFSVVDEDIEFLLTDGETGFYVNAKRNAESNLVVESTADYSLALMVLFAFLGGLILNVMPCVLPVLSLKAFSITATKTSHHWAYLLGILISFWLFAALILGLKVTGNAIGWGFHLQEPLVIAALAFLFIYIALMLWDVAPNGLGLAGVGQQLTEGNGFFSQFFTGVLAVVVASPCTAPFMASALGVAMVSPAVHTLLIFTALALGFALPMTVLSLSPGFAKCLPKPGVWMERFKHFLAFPMMATVMWLVWVFLAQTNSLGQLWLLAGLLIFAMTFWIVQQSSGAKRQVLILLALIIAIYSSVKASGFKPVENQVKSNAFSEQKLTALRNQGDVVFVNMTADWCITCKVNEHVALSDSKVQEVLNSQGVHYLVGDWTNKNQAILEYLTRYQRSGVPLYVVYAGGESHHVLPQVLTPDIVINAIEKAKQELQQ